MGNAGKAGGALGHAIGSLVAKYYTGGIMGNGELDISESGAGPGGGINSNPSTFDPGGGVPGSALELGGTERKKEDEQLEAALVQHMMELIAMGGR
jgi:hypothetical protein